MAQTVHSSTRKAAGNASTLRATFPSTRKAGMQVRGPIELAGSRQSSVTFRNLIDRSNPATVKERLRQRQYVEARGIVRVAVVPCRWLTFHPRTDSKLVNRVNQMLVCGARDMVQNVRASRPTYQER